MALTAQNKVDVRRHAGYGVFGSGTQSLFYWRYYNHYTMLEYRMDNFLAEEENLIVNTYLPTLNQLEMSTAMVGDRSVDNDNLDSLRASVWQWNPNEVSDRSGLYEYYRKILANFMQVPIGPFGMPSSNSVRFIV